MIAKRYPLVSAPLWLVASVGLLFTMAAGLAFSDVTTAAAQESDPCQLEFGPEGSLYVSGYSNPLGDRTTFELDLTWSEAALDSLTECNNRAAVEVVIYVVRDGWVDSRLASGLRVPDQVVPGSNIPGLYLDTPFDNPLDGEEVNREIAFGVFDAHELVAGRKYSVTLDANGSFVAGTQFRVVSQRVRRLVGCTFSLAPTCVLNELNNPLARDDIIFAPDGGPLPLELFGNYATPVLGETPASASISSQVWTNGETVRVNSSAGWSPGTVNVSVTKPNGTAYSDFYYREGDVDSAGRISWTWLVEAKDPTGTYTVRFSQPGKSATATFTTGASSTPASVSISSQVWTNGETVRVNSSSGWSPGTVNVAVTKPNGTAYSDFYYREGDVDSAGRISWTWLVEAKDPTGTYTVRFSQPGKSATATFTTGTAKPAYAAEFVSQSAWRDAAQTQPWPVGANAIVTSHVNESGYWRFRFRNTGTATWRNSGTNPVRLGTWNPRDAEGGLYNSRWVTGNRAANLLEASVRPGGVGTFLVPIESGPTPRSVRQDFNLVADGAAWMNVHAWLVQEVRARPVSPPPSTDAERVPGIIRGFHMTEQGHDAITFQWQEPEDLGNAGQVRYLIELSTTAGAYQFCDTALTSCRIDGLQPDTVYQVRLSSRNDAGYGQWQYSAVATKAAPVPTTQPTEDVAGPIEDNPATTSAFEEFAADPSLNGTHADILRLYWAAFDREPDVGGATWWVNAYNTDPRWGSLIAIGEHFAVSQEFVDTYGPLTNAEFVDAIYLNVLDRPGESAGRLFWVSQLDQGLRTRGEVLADFSYSDEFRANRPLPSDNT